MSHASSIPQAHRPVACSPARAPAQARVQCRSARRALAASAVAAAATLGLHSAAQAAPIISPYAADLSAAAYSSNRSYPGTSAQSVFNGGYWNAGGYGTYWVQADMGTSHTLSEVRLTIDVTPPTATTQVVYLSDTPIGNSWSTLTPVAQLVSHYTTKYQQFTLDFAPASGRYLEVVTYGGASWTAMGDGSGRSDWVDPLSLVPATGGSGGGGSAVPEPGTWALVAAALLAMAEAERRRRAR